MKNEELTLWEEDAPLDEGQELSIWEDDTKAAESQSDEEHVLWDEPIEEAETVYGEEGAGDISLWADTDDLPPISQLLLHEGDELKVTLPEGFEEWVDVACFYWKYYNKGSNESIDIDVDKPLTISLEGAALYGSSDEDKWWKGSEYIKEAADRKDAVGMRQRAVVLLEGLVCERDTKSALKWLHMAAREGDLKALRLLVYALFGMEKILVAPREDAKREDKEGRFIKLTDLFDGVRLSEKDKLFYIKALIDLTKKVYKNNWKGEVLFRKKQFSNDRPLLTFAFGYLIRSYELDKSMIDIESFRQEWGTFLYRFLNNTSEPLYDGIVIPEQKTSKEQIKDLCRILDADEDDLEGNADISWDIEKTFPNKTGKYFDLAVKPRGTKLVSGQTYSVNIVIASNYWEHEDEIKNWPWNTLGMILGRGSHDIGRYNPNFHILCIETLIDKAMTESIDFSSKRGIKRIQTTLYAFGTIKSMAEGDKGKPRFGFDGFETSTTYKRILEKEKKFREMLKKIDESPDRLSIYRKLLIGWNFKFALEALVKEYTKSYSAKEFEILKEESKGDSWPREASYLLGLRYEYGQGTEADWGEAVKCFKNAEYGMFNDNSQKHLKRIEPVADYMQEMKNLLPLLHSPQAAKAAVRVEEMSKAGFSPAKVVIGMQMIEPNQMKRADYYFPCDQAKGLKLLKEAAADGNLAAMHELELIARNGNYGFEPDHSVADKYKRLQLKVYEEDLKMD